MSELPDEKLHTVPVCRPGGPEDDEPKMEFGILRVDRNDPNHQEIAAAIGWDEFERICDMQRDFKGRCDLYNGIRSEEADEVLLRRMTSRKSVGA